MWLDGIARGLCSLGRRIFVPAPSRHSSKADMKKETEARAAAVDRLSEELAKLECAIHRKNGAASR